MKKSGHIRPGVFAALVILTGSLWLILSCKKNIEPADDYTGFRLSSMAIGADSLMPAEYTCDGASSTLPLAWTGAPAATVSYAVIMHHVASPTDIHWYWVLYNIPSSVTSLAKNVAGTGTLGTNSVNDRTQYAPPCSQGPGIKAYTYTLYALSSNPVITIPASQVDRDALLNAIKDITIASTKMTVYYSRNIK